MNNCPFCNIPANRIIAEKGPCIAIRDNYPVTTGHTLILPLRHVASFQKMSREEWAAVHDLATLLTADLQKEDSVIEGFNLGINDGAVAGQSIPHAHIHLIPRRRGDVENPRGGIRHIIPGKGNYPG